MKRRQIALRAAVVVALALGLLAAPLAAGAQPIPRIGLLGDLPWDPLRQGLRDLGYVEGETVVFEARRSGGRNERWPDLAARPSEPPRRSPSSWPSPAIPSAPDSSQASRGRAGTSRG